MKKNLIIAFLLASSLTSLANAKFFLGIDGGYSMDRVDAKALYTPGYGWNPTHTYTQDIEYLPFDIGKMYDGGGGIIGVNLGTEHHFDENNYIGFRWFLSGKYGKTKLVDRYRFVDKEYPSTFLGVGIGLDLLLDVIKFSKSSSVGFFGGITGEFTQLKSDERTSCDLSPNPETRCIYYGGDGGKPARFIDFGSFLASARAGLSVFLANHHRIEFVAEIPIVTSGSSRTSTPVLNNDVNYLYKPIKFILGYKLVF